MNDEKYCPMKYCKGGYCEKEKCAWWSAYPNGESECAIHALPSLYDAIENVATQIVRK